MRAVHVYAKARPDCLAAVTEVLAAIEKKDFKLKLKRQPMDLAGYRLTLALTAGCVTLRKGEEPIQLHCQARHVSVCVLVLGMGAFSWIILPYSSLPYRRAV